MIHTDISVCIYVGSVAVLLLRVAIPVVSAPNWATWKLICRDQIFSSAICLNLGYFRVAAPHTYTNITFSNVIYIFCE